MGMTGIYMWIIISVAALIIDIITSGFFFAGFTIGGISAVIAWMLGKSMFIQECAFIVISGVAIAVEFMWFRKKVKNKIPEPPSLEEKYLGKTVTADKDIENEARMKVEGIYWAVLNKGDKIYKGEKAKIIGISGNKLVIKK
ncbi:MAG TPA: nodulation efficiency protein D [Clostridiaceae bacterium]|jgi:membrane protein implicated in regulation of membrane protease activity|nr:nodulation efficiency protein D [Clostridiaceae bacterium]